MATIRVPLRNPTRSLPNENVKIQSSKENPNLKGKSSQATNQKPRKALGDLTNTSRQAALTQKQENVRSTKQPQIKQIREKPQALDIDSTSYDPNTFAPMEYQNEYLESVDWSFAKISGPILMCEPLQSDEPEYIPETLDSLRDVINEISQMDINSSIADNWDPDSFLTTSDIPDFNSDDDEN